MLAKSIYYGETLASEEDALPSKKGNNWVSLLAKPTFCFSCKWFTALCDEAYKTLTDPG